MGTLFVQLSSGWGPRDICIICRPLLHHVIMNDCPEQSPSNAGPVLCVCVCVCVCVCERERERDREREKYTHTHTHTHTQNSYRKASCRNSYRKAKEAKVWICIFIISILSNPWPMFSYLSGPIILLPRTHSSKMCLLSLALRRQNFTCVYIWFPSSLWPLECRYLLKRVFIDVVFMPSLSGRQCQFWGKQIRSYALSPSLLEARTELPARRKVYGGGFPYPGWEVLLSCECFSSNITFQS